MDFGLKWKDLWDVVEIMEWLEIMLQNVDDVRWSQMG